MPERHARPPADNNVQDVISAIDNYASGPVRALAQDPPQNAADARRNGHTVTVEYKVMTRSDDAGHEVRLLTITDSGTSGLDGPTLSQAELAERERNQGELVIQQGENWAAWEAMRYTKSGEDKLGSRGQGKYAYLYHSAHPAPEAPANAPRHAWRMIILYDTLLPDGEYRLGVRYHNPSTKVIEPPFLADEARAVVRAKYQDEYFTIPLELEPLSEAGTRVIIPFLSDEADAAIRSGEFVSWLEAEWWRKIQKGELEITVETDDGLKWTAGVPSFWDGSPWTDDDRYFVREHVALPSDRPWQRREIKRLVLFDDPALPNTDRDGPPQLNGVQLLRRGQWITTLEMSKFSDLIPREYRDGFRGFVEFEEKLEGELRAIENPAHDGFNSRMGVYREVVRAIEDLVKEFAVEQGWTEDDAPAPEPRFEELVRELADLFIDPTPGSATPADAEWVCRVDAQYPGARARVDWGESVLLDATCMRRPAQEGADVRFTATLIRSGGDRVDILSPRHQTLRTRPGAETSSASASFGRLAVDHPRGRRNALFPEAGRYVVEVACAVGGEVVARGRCAFYVAAEPPPSPARGVTLQLQAQNAVDGSRSIDFGEQLATTVTVRNYTDESVTGELAVTVEGHPEILFSGGVSLSAAVIGDLPEVCIVTPEVRTVVKDDDGSPSALMLGAGEHNVLASLEHEGELLATAAVTIFVGPDVQERGDLPFRVQEISDSPLEPRWSLEDPGLQSDNYMLTWSSADPVFRAVREIRRPVPPSGRIPSEDYLAEIIAEGLVEWAVREFQAHGDEGRLRLVGAGATQAGDDLADRFEDRIERLRGAIDDARMYSELQRELAAMMVEAANRLRN